MSTALRIANAICETQLRAKAALMACGVAEDRITMWDMADVCGLNLDGETACAIVPTWEGGDVEYVGPGSVTIDVSWSTLCERLIVGPL